MGRVLLALCIQAALQTGCGFELPRRTADGDQSVEIPTPVGAEPTLPTQTLGPESTVEERRPSPSPDVETSDDPGDDRPPGDAAAEVIQRRIAWRETHAPDTRSPTPTPIPVFGREFHGDEIASSADLGLMWPRDAAGGFNQEDAHTYCEVLDLGGYDDWRLPSVDELHGLMFAELDLDWGDDVRMLWSSTPHDPRGFETIGVPGLSRSHMVVGVAHAVCVRNVAPGEGS